MCAACDHSRISSFSRIVFQRCMACTRCARENKNYYFNYELSRLICSFAKAKFRSCVYVNKAVRVRFCVIFTKNSRIYLAMFVKREWLKTAAFREKLNTPFFPSARSKFYFRLLLPWNWRLFLFIFHKHYKWRHILYLRFCVWARKYYGLFTLTCTIFGHLIIIDMQDKAFEIDKSECRVSIYLAISLAHCNILQMYSTYKVCDTECRIKRINFIHRPSVSSCNFQTG